MKKYFYDIFDINHIIYYIIYSYHIIILTFLRSIVRTPYKFQVSKNLSATSRKKATTIKIRISVLMISSSAVLTRALASTGLKTVFSQSVDPFIKFSKKLIWKILISNVRKISVTSLRESRKNLSLIFLS